MNAAAYRRDMPLDPQAKQLLDQMTAMGTPPLDSLPVPDARLLMESMRGLMGDPEPIAHVEERAIPVPDGGTIPARLYRPSAPGPLPLLVYFHGGGWVLGGLESHDGVCRNLANQAGCAVLSIDYRLAPEHRYPTAAEDCWTALVWAAAHANELGADPARIAIGGDSAGGNLTAVVALLARDRKGPRLRFQLLIYPVTDHSYETPSYTENADGYFLTRSAMVWFWNHYLGDDAGTDRLASPLRCPDLTGLPPALVVTAEYDPLRDEGEAYAKRLREAGVPTTLTRYDGMIHGFFTMGPLLDQGKRAVEESAKALRAAFA
jgi:acetyl esterase